MFYGTYLTFLWIHEFISNLYHVRSSCRLFLHGQCYHLLEVLKIKMCAPKYFSLTYGKELDPKLNNINMTDIKHIIIMRTYYCYYLLHISFRLSNSMSSYYMFWAFIKINIEFIKRFDDTSYIV